MWVGDYKGLETAVPLVDGSAHTIGRLQFKFLGKAQATRYQELLDCCWAMTIKSAHLDKEHTALELPPEEWDTRVKITSYPGKSKGTTNLLEDCGRDPVWNETLRAPCVVPCAWSCPFVGVVLLLVRPRVAGSVLLATHARLWVAPEAPLTPTRAARVV